MLPGLPTWFVSKESACQCRKHRFNSWARKLPWKRKWQPTPVFLSGKSHGQRSLTGYNHGVTKMLDTTQQLNNSNITLPAIEYGSSTNTPLKNIKRYFFKVKKRYPSSKISETCALSYLFQHYSQWPRYRNNLRAHHRWMDKNVYTLKHTHT